MSAETSASVRPTSGISPACSWAATRSAASAAVRSAATSAGSLAWRSGADHLGGAAEAGVAGQPVEQVDHVAGPRLVAHRDAAGAGDQRPATRSMGSSVSAQPRMVKASPRGTTRGHLQVRDEQRGSAVAGQHQHREAGQVHRLVADEPGQVAADGGQHDVDTRLGHGLADPVEPTGVVGWRRWGELCTGARLVLGSCAVEGGQAVDGERVVLGAVVVELGGAAALAPLVEGGALLDVAEAGHRVAAGGRDPFDVDARWRCGAPAGAGSRPPVRRSPRRRPPAPDPARRGGPAAACPRRRRTAA